MPRSKIPSPARSEGVKMTPRRHRFRSSRSVSSPARSDTSMKLSSIVQMHAMKSPVLSPLRTRRSILSDNTDIEVPGRKSWWRNLEENSRDVMEVFESKTTEQPDNIEEFIEADFKSQENDYTVDLPESSDGESIRSIVIPQRKFFSQKQTQAHELFNKIIENRDNLTHRKSKANTDNTIFVGKKNLFNRDTEERSRPVFPAGLLNMTEDKTLMNKTHDTTKHGQIRNLLGNRAGTKRKNMFAQFIMSESEDEIPDIQPNVFGFSKSKQQQQRKMSASQSTRTTSPKSNETDLEFDDWQHLPSSTMVDNEFGNTEDDSPVKRPRLSKTNSVIEAIQGNIRNKLNKTKQTMLVPHSRVDDKEATEKSDMKKNVLNDTYEKTLTTQIPHAESDNNLGQSAAEIIQVDSDDENNFTLRYENDKNMQENDEIDITVKELVKNNSSTHEENTSRQTNITKKVLNSPSSLKGETNAINKSNNQPVSIETKEPCDANKMVNDDQSRNISWKVLETYQEHHAAINPREDLCEKDEIKKTNTSASTINREDACDEIDNREISFERGNSICHEEKTYFEATSTKNPQEAGIIERNQRNIMQEEEKSKKREDLKLHPLEAKQQINKSIEKIDEQEQKSLVVESMDVDDVNIDGKALNENQKEEGNHNYEVNNKDNAVPCKEKEIDYIAGDLKNIEKESVEETDKQSTTSSTHVNNETKHDLNENKKETAKGILIEEKQTETNCEENCEGEVEEHREKDNIVTYSTEQNEIPDKINKETQQIPITSLDENIDREDEENCDDNNEYKNVDEDENNAEDNKATNKSLEEPDDQMASVFENIQPEHEGSDKDDDEKQEHDDEQQEDDDEKDNVEESGVSNEMNEEIDKQTGISSMDVNIETEDEETPEDSDEEHREEDEDGENSEEENETTDKNNEETDNRGGISSVNESIQTENGENNEEDDEEDDKAEKNEMVNESNEETGNEIGMPSLDENIETEDEEEGNSYEESHQEINVESERRNDSNSKPDNHRVTFSKGRIYLTNVTGESTNSLAEEVAEESDHEESRTRQLALEQCLMKIKNDNIERRRKIEEEVRNSLNAPLRKPLNNFNAPVRPRSSKPSQRTDMASAQTKTKAKKVTSLLNIDLPPEILDDLKYKPPRRYQPKNASWTTKRLYKYLESKLEPKYDYKARVMAEKLVKAMYEFTKEVRRHRVAPHISVDVLKQQMARTGVVSTHYDFYKFFRDFMPREIRIKVVPDVVNEIPLPRNGVFSDIV